jgi:hypothetical protein
VCVSYHAHDKCADKVGAGLFAALARYRVLCYTIISRYFGNGAEKEVCAVRQPIYPS